MAYRAIRENRLQGRLLDACAHAPPARYAEVDAILAEAEHFATQMDAQGYVFAALEHLDNGDGGT